MEGARRCDAAAALGVRGALSGSATPAVMAGLVPAIHQGTPASPGAARCPDARNKSGHVRA